MRQQQEYLVKPPGQCARAPRLVIFGCSMLLAALCATSVCAAPELRIPKPTDPLKPAPPPPTLESSVVNLEVRLPAETLAAAIDEGFPQVASREDDWSNAAALGDRQDVRVLYRLVRGSFRYRMDKGRFDVWFDQVRYRLWARRSEGDQFIDGRCGHGDDPPKRLQLAAHSALTWSDRWRLQSQTTFDAPVFLEPCGLVGLDVDATPFLNTMLEARLTTLAQRIDGIIRERTEAKKRAENVWRALQEPVEFGPNQWLEFNPRDARVSPITSSGTLVVHTSVNLIMEPKIVNGSRGEKAAIPLPRLQLAPLAQEGFYLALPITVDYGRINQRLEQEMIGQEWRTPLGDQVKVEGVQLYGSGDRLILAVRMSGGVNGTVYATGTPTYDESLEVVKFVDLDFTMDTRNVLVRSANWMFHENILSTLRSEAFIALSEQLRTMRSRLKTALTRELGGDTRMEAEITALRPRGIYPAPGGVEVHVIAEGSIWVELK